MSRAIRQLTGDGRKDEQALLRMVTDAYSLSAAWPGLGEVRAAIERDIRNVQDPGALGLSPEFAYWEPVVSWAGVVWNVDNYGTLTVES